MKKAVLLMFILPLCAITDRIEKTADYINTQSNFIAADYSCFESEMKAVSFAAAGRHKKVSADAVYSLEIWKENSDAPRRREDNFSADFGYNLKYFSFAAGAGLNRTRDDENKRRAGFGNLSTEIHARSFAAEISVQVCPRWYHFNPETSLNISWQSAMLNRDKLPAEITAGCGAYVSRQSAAYFTAAAGVSLFERRGRRKIKLFCAAGMQRKAASVMMGAAVEYGRAGFAWSQTQAAPGWVKREAGVRISGR